MKLLKKKKEKQRKDVATGTDAIHFGTATHNDVANFTTSSRTPAEPRRAEGPWISAGRRHVDTINVVTHSLEPEQHWWKTPKCFTMRMKYQLSDVMQCRA